jgi:hypothetical protein
MDNQQKTCTCSRDGYSPDCPQSFVQGDQILHAISGETRLKPRVYLTPYCDQDTHDKDGPMTSAVKFIDSELAATRIAVDAGHEKGQQGVDIAPRPLAPIVRRVETHDGDAGTGYMADEGMGLGRGSSLQKFAPLRLNGVSMTEAVIGGFKIGVEETAQQVRKYAPLPPVCLPIIFRDSDLNFLHHFFQGLETIAGRGLITSLAEEGNYSDRDGQLILPLVKAAISEGHRDGDTELTTFVKRVLDTTFEPITHNPHAQEQEWLRVKSNFYGFQYIEVGMQCKENDAKMWLHMAYSQYKMVWFNSFKASGVPAFAMEGVQDRYRGSNVVTQEGRRHAQEYRYVESRDREETIARSTRKPREHRRKSRSPKEQEASMGALERWMAGKRSN